MKRFALIIAAAALSVTLSGALPIVTGAITVGDLEAQLNQLIIALNLQLPSAWRTVTPEQFGAVGNGIVDDTAALQAACKAVQNGGYMISAGSRTYLVNSGVTLSDNAAHSLCAFTAGNVTIDMNGSTILDGTTYGGTGTNFAAFQISAGRHYVITGAICKAKTPVVLPVSAVIGYICVGVAGGSQIQIVHPQMYGGLAPVDVYASSSQIGIYDSYSQDSVYGVVTPSGGGQNSYISEQCQHVQRCAFTYGAQAQEWHVTSQNDISNDFLIAGNAAPTTNLDIWYTVLARTNGQTLASYMTIDEHVASAILSNINIHLDIDMSGDNSATAGPAVVMGKYTTAAFGATVANVSISGNIRNIGANYTANAVDWNQATDASWSGETQYAIDFHDLVIDPLGNFRADMAPFSTTKPGMIFAATQIAGTRTFVNDNTGKRIDGPNVFIGGVQASAGLYNVLNATNFAIGGAVVLFNNGGYIDFRDGNGADTILLGSTGDHENYYRQTAHLFQNIGGGTTFVTINSTGLTDNAIATDATHTDATVCEDTTTHAFFFGSGASGVCLGTSSARFKHDVEPLRVSGILDLRPISYRYNKGIIDGGAAEHYGFLAEDVVKVFPKLVGLDAQGRPNSVDMIAMVPLLVGELQRQRHEIDALRREIARR